MIILLRADYDLMPKVSKGFDREAANVKRSIESLNRTLEALKGGDWFGEGATAFFKEMDSQVMPSMKRLQTALEAGSRANQAIERLYHDTEEAIGGLFSAMLATFGASITVEVSGLGGAAGGGGGGGSGGGSGGGGGGSGGGGGGGAGGSEPEKPASGGGGGGSGGGGSGGGGGGGGGSWDGEIGFKPESPAPGQSPAAPRRRR